MKKILFLLSIFIAILSFSPQNVFAKSGCCSSHGGVNCAAGPQANGKVICNDGNRNSSCLYSEMVMCGGSTQPTAPVVQPQVVNTPTPRPATPVPTPKPATPTPTPRPTPSVTPTPSPVPTPEITPEPTVELREETLPETETFNTSTETTENANEIWSSPITQFVMAIFRSMVFHF